MNYTYNPIFSSFHSSRKFTIPINGNSIYHESLKIEIKRLHVKLILFCAHTHTPTSPNHVQCTALEVHHMHLFPWEMNLRRLCWNATPPHYVLQQPADCISSALCHLWMQQWHSGLRRGKRRQQKKKKKKSLRIIVAKSCSGSTIVQLCRTLTNSKTRNHFQKQNQNPVPSRRPLPGINLNFQLHSRKKTGSADQRFSRRLGLYF